MSNVNITSLDLTQNHIVGAMPFGLCRLSDQIQVLAADCDQVYCSCCTRCDSNGTRAPFMAPGSPPPTPHPRLTAVPSLQPSLEPTAPGPPTPRPTSPTPQPTLDPFCKSIIQTSKRCYTVGESISVIFSNCDPTITDWIGIYNIDEPEDALFDPLLSHRTCINAPCWGVKQFSTIALDGSGRGSYNWPLPSGRYKIYLFRGGSAVGPHTFFSKSLFITVADDSCW
mmetsp:Transcript_12715/g.30305  ORF Transcript_12715/g.30305 Transcript_12715/m.30305 type:complete len:226 (-) Transcript_12715:99-776(-)